MNQVRKYRYLGKKIRVTYVPHRRCYLLAINNRLHPQHFKTELAAMVEAYRRISEESLPGISSENNAPECR